MDGNTKYYVVICYSLHTKEISGCEVFNNKKAACDFLSENAKESYEQIIEDSTEEEKDKIKLNLCNCNDNVTAYLSCCDGEYEWTWEIIEVPGELKY